MGGLAGVRGRCLSTAAAGTSLAATQRQPARSLMGSSILRQHRCLTASAAAGGGAEHDWAASRAPAQLRSLRLAPPPQLHRSSRFPLPLRAASGAWPQQPGQGPYHQQQDHQQQRDYSSQPPWWQFWAQPAATREPSNGTDGSDGGLRPPEPLPANNPSASVERELHAVNVAVVVNAAIFVAKMLTWAVTGSGALLAEGMHSLADVANQLLLKHGVIRSRRKPTREHQYGFHKEKYVYALISAACVFCVGCGASVLHGVSSLLNPHALENMSYSLAVLLGSSMLEAYSLNVAFQSIRSSAEEQGMSVLQYIRRGRDPTTVAILWEDGGAVAGLGLAGAFTVLTYLTGQQHWDALGSIAVGLLMGVIAVQLMRTNKRFLIGQAMEPATERLIVEHLQNDNMVVRVIDPKSEEMGDGVYRFKAEIQWSGEHVVGKFLGGLGRDSVYRQIRSVACTTANGVDESMMRDAMDMAMMDFGKGVIRTVGSEIDRLESELKELVPGLVYVDLETDKGALASREGSVMGSADWPEVDLDRIRQLYEGGGSAHSGGNGPQA